MQNKRKIETAVDEVVPKEAVEVDVAEIMAALEEIGHGNLVLFISSYNLFLQ